MKITEKIRGIMHFPEIFILGLDYGENIGSNVDMLQGGSASEPL